MDAYTEVIGRIFKVFERYTKISELNALHPIRSIELINLSSDLEVSDEATTAYGSNTKIQTGFFRGGVESVRERNKVLST